MTDLSSIFPELILAAGGMILLILPFLRSGRLLGLITLALLIAAFDAGLLPALKMPAAAASLSFSGMLVQDRFSQFFQAAILLSSALAVLSVMGYAREKVRSRREFYSLLLFATAGLLLVVRARHLALIYLSIELISVLSYLLVGFNKRDEFAIEGALKYFLFGALSTGAMLYGITLVYGLTGRMDLAGLAGLAKTAVTMPGLTVAAVLLLSAGLAFKLALAPFHMWAPDAYEGASTPVASFISMGPKLAAFALLARLFLLGIPAAAAGWPLLFGGLAVVSMTIGNLAALGQTNVKRMLAYSSIAHAGTMAIGIAVATPFGLAAVMYYGLAYLLMNAAAFAGVIAVANLSGREDLGAFAGLSRREPAMAFMITIAFLSLAGIPPLAGFFGKMWIFGAALQAGAVGLAVIGAVNSVISLYYYARVIKAMYIEPAATPARLPRSRSLRLALALCAAGLFLLGLWQGPWLDLTARSLPLTPKAGDLPWR